MVTESNVKSIKSKFVWNVAWIDDVAMQWFLFRSCFFFSLFLVVVRNWNSLETIHVSCTRTVAHTPFGIRSMLCDAHKCYTWALNECKIRLYIYIKNIWIHHHTECSIRIQKHTRSKCVLLVLFYIALFFSCRSSEDDILRCYKSSITWKRSYTIDRGGRLIVCGNEERTRRGYGSWQLLENFFSNGSQCSRQTDSIFSIIITLLYLYQLLKSYIDAPDSGNKGYLYVGMQNALGKKS